MNLNFFLRQRRPPNLQYTCHVHVMSCHAQYSIHITTLHFSGLLLLTLQDYTHNISRWFGSVGICQVSRMDLFFQLVEQCSDLASATEPCILYYFKNSIYMYMIVYVLSYAANRQSTTILMEGRRSGFRMVQCVTCIPVEKREWCSPMGQSNACMQVGTEPSSSPMVRENSTLNSLR